MNKLVYAFTRIREIFFEHCNCIRFYKTCYGLKNTGAKFLLGGKRIVSEPIVELVADQLYLGPDFLKDKYTLLNCPISSSPHMELMTAINNNEELSKTDYIRRYIDGRLDWRRGNLEPKNYEKYYKKFSQSRTEIENGNYKPVVVYKLGGKHYIYDGKHRAALCSLLDVPVKCILVESDICNSDMWHYMFSIVQDNHLYSQHHFFHSSYLMEIE